MPRSTVPILVAFSGLLAGCPVAAADPPPAGGLLRADGTRIVDGDGEG